jgi:hypothetical protein
MTDQIQTIEPEVVELVSRKPSFAVITKPEESEITAKYLTDIQQIRKRIAEFFKPDIEKAHQLHKSLIAKMNQVDAEPARIEMICRQMLSDWQDRERKRIQEEQRRLDEEAKKKAIKEAQKDGDEKLAKAIETGKVAIAAEKNPEPIFNPAGVSMREYWWAEVVDANKIPRQYLVPDMTALNAVMRATKGQAKIPGVRAIRETGIAKRNAA